MSRKSSSGITARPAAVLSRMASAPRRTWSLTSLKVRLIASRCGFSERFNTTICSAIAGFGSTSIPRDFTAVEMEAQQVSGACQASFVLGYSPGLRASFMGGCCSLGYEASSSSIQTDRSLPLRARELTAAELRAWGNAGHRKSELNPHSKPID